LEDVPIKVGDFYASTDFVILHIAEDAHAQMILRKPFLTIARCKIDVKRTRLTFDVGKDHATLVSFTTKIFLLLHLLVVDVM